MEDAARHPVPILVTAVGKQYCSDEQRYLYLSPDARGGDYLIHDQAGQLVFKVESRGIFFEKKTLTDGQGNTVCTAKKLFLSLAKWSIVDASGCLVAKTRCVAGLVKYGIEVIVPSHDPRQPIFKATPDLSLRQVVMWQQNGRGQPDSPLCDAAYGSNVQLGFISAAVRNWTYHMVLHPGADAALVCIMLAIYTELMDWNALSGIMGMT